MSTSITAEAGRAYGHVPGHRYLDVTITLESSGYGYVATVVIELGCAQGRGCDQPGPGAEYARTGDTPESALERAIDQAKRYEDDDETARYIETAHARALAELTGEEAEAA
jgi:hypothetical protein